MERIAVAIFHASTKTVSRSAGRSAVASAAYRAGVELVDERTGLVHDYTRRGGVVATEILIPGGGSAERNALWNAAEQAEKRKDGRTAREWVIALPAELDAAQRAALAREFAAALVERYGVAVDLAIHRPDREGDNRNHHAHLLTTTRQVSRASDGSLVLGDKASIELSDTKRRALGLGPAADEIGAVRELWEQIANRALERAGSAERIDSRSLAAQGIDREATQHLGPIASEMERRGAPSDRGDGNRQAAANNERRAQLTAEIIDLRAERERRRPAPEVVHQVEDRTPGPRLEAGALAGLVMGGSADPYERPQPRSPAPAPDPLERWREAVAQAERGGDAVELVQRRAELAAAAALVAQDKPPTHHLTKITEAGKAAALAYLRGDTPPDEPRRGPESGDPQAGGATGRATPERPAVAAFRAELEREQQRRDAERQAKRQQLTAEIVAAQVERAKLVAERAEKRRFADSTPEIARLDISAEQDADKAARRRLADEQSRGWLVRLLRGSARREAEREATEAGAALDAATERQRQAEVRDREAAILERRLTRIKVDSLAGHIAAIDRQLPDLRAALADLDAPPKPAAPEAVAPVQVQDRTQPEPRRPAPAPETPKPARGPLEHFERQLNAAKRGGDPGEIGSAIDELIAARRLLERGDDPANDNRLWAELQDVWRERAAGALPSREEALAEMERPQTPTDAHRAPKQRSRGPRPRGPRGAEID